jgi:hypothetical protein
LTLQPWQRVHVGSLDGLGVQERGPDFT